MPNKGNLLEVASVFFTLGCFAFGGPAAHIAMMEQEIVHKRKWMSLEHFLDLMGVTNLIPGPNSTEMTMHCGHERAGTLGLFVAGFCFIFPAVVITGILAWLYVEYGQLPEVSPFLYGIKPAVLAIIAAAIFKLGKKALKNRALAVLGLSVLVACFVGVNEILALLGGGLLGALYFYLKDKPNTNLSSLIFPFFLFQTPTLIASKITATGVFLTFLKVGAILYGSGYVLFAYLDSELVSISWLSRQELIDAIAIGQFTPGPVLSTATFVGYQLAGFWGALGATLGIFLPSFLFVLILNPLVPKMRKSIVLGYFLDAVNVAALALMVAVLVEMSISSLSDWQTITIAVLSTMLTFGIKNINPMWIIAGAAVLGYILSTFI